MYTTLIMYVLLGVVSLAAEESQFSARSDSSEESDIQYPLQMQNESLLIYGRQGNSQFGEE
ncbi:MAG: hypothetical protein NTX05_08385, partial [Fusobacteria bacterium]|nr:hypothetical protein [Fusobacteriota bacterium]